MHGGRDPEVDLGMRFGEAAKPVDQPFGGKIGRRADCERARRLTLPEAFGAERDAVERIAQHSEIFTPLLGDDEALPLAREKLEAEFRLERLDLVAHRSLRHAQLLRRARKALVPRRGLESLEGIERRKASQHAKPHEENYGIREKACFAVKVDS